MLTLFSIPKAFKGHIAVIQRNAIRSWGLLRPSPEILLFGSDAGTAEVAQEFGVRHLPDVATNEYGTPLLNDMFRRAEAATASPWLCYVNADILVLNDFLGGVENAARCFPKCLVVSKRINLDIREELAFDLGWENSLRQRATIANAHTDYTGIDVFAFSRGLYPQIPDFAIGRLWFDHWLIKAVLAQNLPVVDASFVAPVLHQNHDYNHVPGGEQQVWSGKEAAHNLQLYGGVRNAVTLLDVTHEMTPQGAIRRVRLRKPLVKLKALTWDLLVRRTVGIRDSLRLRRKFWRTGHRHTT